VTVVKVLDPKVGSVVVVYPDIVVPDEVGACVVSDVSGAVVETPLQAIIANTENSKAREIKLLLNSRFIMFLLMRN
jgi:hypothetical protein